MAARSGARARSAPLGRLLRAELYRATRRPRTLVVFAGLAAVPLLLGLGVAAGWPSRSAAAPGTGLMVAATHNGLALPVIALAVTLSLPLPLAVGMAAAGALAGEAAHGSLRALLLAPVGRPRLVGVKAVGLLAVAALSVLAVAVVGLVVGLMVVGTGAGGQLLTLSGTTVGGGAAVGRIALAAGWTLLQLAAVGAVALAVSSLTDSPLVTLTAVLGGAIGCVVLSTVPAAEWLRPWLLTSGWPALVDVLRDPLPADGLLRSSLVAGGYLAAGLVVAVIGTMRREA